MDKSDFFSYSFGYEAISIDFSDRNNSRITADINGFD